MSAISSEQTSDEAWPDAAPEDMPGWRDVLRSENAKLRSIYRLVALRAIDVITILLIGISAANSQSRGDLSIPPGTCATQAAQIRALQLAGAADPLNVVLSGVGLAAILFACFGAYCARVEYTNGMIRSTLTAVPRRGGLFAAKLAAALFLAAPAILVSVAAVFWIGDAVLARRIGVSVGAFDGRALLRLFGAVVLLLGASAMGFAVGLIVRGTAGSVVVPIVLFLLLNALLGAADGGSVQEYLAPLLVGERLYGGSVEPPRPAAAYPLFLAWPLLLSAAAYLRFTRSDAG